MLPLLKSLSYSSAGILRGKDCLLRTDVFQLGSDAQRFLRNIHVDALLIRREVLPSLSDASLIIKVKPTSQISSAPDPACAAFLSSSSFARSSSLITPEAAIITESRGLSLVVGKSSMLLTRPRFERTRPKTTCFPSRCGVGTLPDSLAVDLREEGGRAW